MNSSCMFITAKAGTVVPRPVHRSAHALGHLEPVPLAGQHVEGDLALALGTGALMS